MATNPSSKRGYTVIQSGHDLKTENAARKRAKNHDARALAVQSADAALSATGELDVAAYVGAREYEIRALEAGMNKAKGAMMSRAFQKVPRSLRRRTASHNVKRVPKRLQARAKREMIEDNTPTGTGRQRKSSRLLRIRLETVRRLQGLNKRTKAKRATKKAQKEDKFQGKDKAEAATTGGHDQTIAPRIPKIKKNKLSRPSPPDQKYKKRQRSKTWLPTHMFHAKRAHMTPPAEPLWRFAIPLTPTEKSYRPTHRAAGSRGAIAWDMSYISTIQLDGTSIALQETLKALQVDGDDCWGSTGRKWRQGTRVLQKWLHEADETRRPIAPVTLIWCAKCACSEEEDRDLSRSGDKSRPKTRNLRDKIFIRVHPSAFLDVWNVLLKVCKKQNPPVNLQDLRFDIGSIDITGPGSTEALIGAIHPCETAEPTEKGTTSHAATWKSLLGVTNPASLPNGALLSFSMSDPRLHTPMKTIRPSKVDLDSGDLTSLLSSWPPDKTRIAPALFDRSSRLIASRRLPSQKAINRRRTLAGLGKPLKPQPTDPQIPVMIFASRMESSSRDINNHGTWTIMLPWKCVAPLWYVLMYYPLSSGVNPRFGGIKEKRQLAFQYGQPWFPGDFPGTRAGWEWNVREQGNRKRNWERKPKGRRIEFDSLDLGNGQKGEIGRGWACDWERLVQGTNLTAMDETQDTDSSGIKETALLSSGTEPNNLPPLGIEFLKLDAKSSTRLNTSGHPWNFPRDKPCLATVRISLFGRGTPTPCARIYRLPLRNHKLREQWLSVKSSSKRNTSQKKKKESSVQGKSEHAHNAEYMKKLAASLLVASEPEPTSEIAIPPENDLIGFVSSGNFNLTEGKGTGIGSILTSKLIEIDQLLSEITGHSGSQSPSMKKKDPQTRRMCIVRSAGERVGRLGLWEFV